MYRRLREDAPLYYIDAYDAFSRFDDIERCLLDRQSFTSGRSGIIELIKTDIEMPSGVLICEDPLVHTIHRRLLSRAFTARRVAELEDKIRMFCTRSLDLLVGAGGFDFIAGIGAQMPMRTISVLRGIPEADQEAVREHVDATLRTEAGRPMVARYVGRGFELGGRTVSPGAALLLLVASANRDERRFPDGDRFDAHRQVGQHLTFAGTGHWSRRRRPTPSGGRRRIGRRWPPTWTRCGGSPPTNGWWSTGSSSRQGRSPGSPG